jgi:LPXTG-site transpeptidase (sortase) family protein
MSPGNGDFRNRKFGEMTTVPRQVGRQVAGGLVAIIAAVSVALAGESSAGAAIYAHSSHPQRVTAKRDIRHERLLRDTRNPPGTRRPRTRPGAKKAPRSARSWTVSAPSVGLAADLTTLSGPGGPAGIDGLSLPVPPLARAARDAGWYNFTAVPGGAGNAVIVGHVDTYAGPAVFYNLYQLRPGDQVYVDADGTRRRFDVTSVREMPKPSFPVNQVFGGTKRHMLWLITCGGAFDYETGHYLDNIVVSATWDPPKKERTGEKEHAKRSENHLQSVRWSR